MPRPHLSEDAEREEAEDRDRIRAAETKLRELKSRRQLAIDQVYRLSDEQKALFDQRQPRQEALDRTHEEHRSLGRQISDLRRQRDTARKAAEEALIAVRLARQEQPPGGDQPRPDQIRREIAQLELKQQTTALPLADENALIDRLRQLTKHLNHAQEGAGRVEGLRKRRLELEENLRARRLEADRLGHEMDRARVERDRRMESMRAQLVEVGRLVGEIREKAKARGEVMARVDEMSRQIYGLEKDVFRMIQASRDRRHEARKTMGDYNRSVRETVSGPDAYARNADEQLEQLLKRGRITLSP